MYHGEGMTRKLKKLRNVNPYDSDKIISDARFWDKFQQDFCTTVIIKKSKITHIAQYVDLGHTEQKNDPIFNEVISTCEQQRVKFLMGFRYD